MGSRAILVIDGGNPRAVAVGEQHGGIKVIAVHEQNAVLEIDGRQRTLKMGQNVASTVSSDQERGTARLTVDSTGHFLATGQINGHSVRFMVDTGASNIAMGISEARRLGLDMSLGTPGQAITANGVVNITLIRLDTVTVGEITLRNVEATVGQDMPFVLLGMSFLSRTSMQRDGDTMVLKRRV
jgi:aspartyl protease family protein